MSKNLSGNYYYIIKILLLYKGNYKKLFYFVLMFEKFSLNK